MLIAFGVCCLLCLGLIVSLVFGEIMVKLLCCLFCELNGLGGFELFRWFLIVCLLQILFVFIIVLFIGLCMVLSLFFYLLYLFGFWCYLGLLCCLFCFVLLLGTCLSLWILFGFLVVYWLFSTDWYEWLWFVIVLLVVLIGFVVL